MIIEVHLNSKIFEKISLKICKNIDPENEV